VTLPLPVSASGTDASVADYFVPVADEDLIRLEEELVSEWSFPTGAPWFY